jgi:hypothetical protein
VPCRPRRFRRGGALLTVPTERSTPAVAAATPPAGPHESFAHLTVESAPAASALLAAVKQQIGMVPNLMKVLAHSPAGLGAYSA